MFVANGEPRIPPSRHPTAPRDRTHRYRTPPRRANQPDGTAAATAGAARSWHVARCCERASEPAGSCRDTECTCLSRGLRALLDHRREARSPRTRGQLSRDAQNTRALAAMQAAASSAHGRRLQALSRHVAPRATAAGGGRMAIDLSGRLCLVTGVGHGIGKHVAALLTELGGTVYGSDLRFDDFGAPLDGKDLQVSLADTAVVDITDQASVRSWVQRAEREHGGAVPAPPNNSLDH